MTYIDRTDAFMRSLDLPETYLVGGAVRSMLLRQRVKDGDYIVRGADLKTLRARARAKGAEVTNLKLRDGRVVGVRIADKKRKLGVIEVCLPRSERKLEFDRPMDKGNTRHAFEIVTDPSITLEEDAKRRDFTINALYKRVRPMLDGGMMARPIGVDLEDPTGLGLADLQARLIRTTHPDSFRDDPLRTLRALRFLAVLPDFEIEAGTLEQMREHAGAVTGLTGKGVSGTALDELTKMLMGDHVAKALRVARDTGVLATLLPELADMIGFGQESKYHSMTVDEHTFTAIDWAARGHCSLRVRLALLFHDAGKPLAAWRGDDGHLHYYDNGDSEIHVIEEPTYRKTEDHAAIGASLAKRALARLNAPNDLRRDVPLLVKHHMVPLTMRLKPTKVRKWRCDLGDEMLADLFKHRLADCMGKGAVDYDALRAIERMERIREEAEKAGVPKSPKDLKDAGLIDGNDLIEMGVKGGDIGRILTTLLHEVVTQPSHADREWLLGRARKLAGSSK